MPRELLPAELQEPSRPVMRTWKWIGLGVFAAGLLLARWLPPAATAVAYVCGVVVLINLFFLFLRRLKNYVFWSVRNRVIGSFIFIGLIPLVVLAGVLYLSLRMLLGALASNLLESNVAELARELSSIHGEIAQQLPRDEAPTALDELARRTFAGHAVEFPRLAARLARKRADGTFETVRVFDPHGLVPPLERYPAEKWLGSKPSYDGLVGTKQTMLLASVRPLLRRPDHYLEVSVPVDSHLEERLTREKSLYAVFLSTEGTSLHVSQKGVKLTNESETSETEIEATIQKRIATLDARRAPDTRRMISWVVLLDSRSVATGKDVAGIAIVYVPFQVIRNQYLAGGSEVGQIFLTLTYILLGIFVFAEVVSVVIGATISRRITRSVHDMYQGTLALQKGDLGYRIPVRRADQLGLLAHSFNRMSGSIVRLLEEVSEKKRLEQELEIAREVQATLFPRQLPNPRGLTIFGGCEPARVVSGDYYDFVVEDAARLNIIIGDISGKGISAALLMANLQAAMRSQLAFIKAGNEVDVEKGMADVMIQLNQQIYQSSPSEKYATLVLSRFDADTRRLYYCNAGHLPPILLVGGEVRRLEAGGVVLGLFPNMTYSAGSIELARGTVLVLFTDGVTEALNDADEEFGEDRLIAALAEAGRQSPEEIYGRVVERVRDWQGNLPQHDDITLIVARVE